MNATLDASPCSPAAMFKAYRSAGRPFFDNCLACGLTRDEGARLLAELQSAEQQAKEGSKPYKFLRVDVCSDFLVILSANTFPGGREYVTRPHACECIYGRQGYTCKHKRLAREIFGGGRL